MSDKLRILDGFNQSQMIYDAQIRQELTQVGLASFGKMFKDAILDTPKLAALASHRPANLTDSAPNALMFLVNQLSYHAAGAMLVEYPALRFRDLININGQVPELDDSYDWKVKDKVGQARFGIALGADDTPTVTSMLSGDIAKIYYGDVAADYNIEELAKSMANGTPIDSERTMIAREAAEVTLNDVALVGHKNIKEKGIINQASGVIAPTNVVAGASTKTEWFADASGLAVKTIDEVMADINKPIADIVTITNKSVIPNTVAIPDNYLLAMGSTRMGQYQNMTMLEYVKAMNISTKIYGKDVNFIGLSELRGAGATNNGDSIKNRMIVYEKSPNNLEMVINKPLGFLSPERRGMKFIIPGYYKASGVIIKRKEAFRYVDKI